MAHLRFYHYSGEFRVAVGMTTMIWNMMGLNALKFATKETFEKLVLEALFGLFLIIILPIT
jgi:hypothetical protein